jgi:hypothetical protein
LRVAVSSTVEDVLDRAGELPFALLFIELIEFVRLVAPNESLACFSVMEGWRAGGMICANDICK